MDYCLRQANLKPSDLTYIGYYEKPFSKFDRLLETYLGYAPRGFASFRHAMPIWLKQKLHIPREIRHGLGDHVRRRYAFVEHHQAHAASAFFPSPFEEAAILTLDGVGEWATAAFGSGRGNTIRLTRQMQFPHSLGLLYSAFTYYTGFSVNSGEYKLMGLAPYGEPRFERLILEHLIDLKEDGSFRMDMAYFNYAHGLTMTSPKFHELFGGPPRKPDSLLTERDMDLAASIQRVAETIIVRCAAIGTESGLTNLCLAGGVALNCVANARILETALRARVGSSRRPATPAARWRTALFIWHQLLAEARQPEPNDSQRGIALGPAFGTTRSEGCWKTPARRSRVDTDAALCDQIAAALAEGGGRLVSRAA